MNIAVFLGNIHNLILILHEIKTEKQKIFILFIPVLESFVWNYSYISSA